MNRSILIKFFLGGCLCLFLLPIHSHALTLTPIRFEVSGDPGQTLVEQMTLINDSTSTAEQYSSSFANFEAQGETGTPTFVAATDDLGTWMTTSQSVFLPPGTSKTIPLTITIPKDAEPGGHFAAVFWGLTPQSSGPNQVAIGAETGILVLLRVNGNISEKGGILDFNTDDLNHFFTALPVHFYYRFENNGGDRVEPQGNIVMKDMLGFTSSLVPANVVEGNILPNSIRKFETTWEGKDGSSGDVNRPSGFFANVKYEWNNFAFGPYSANLMLTYGTKNEQANATIHLWVFPWQLTLVSVIALLILFLILRFSIRRYNHWIIRQANTSKEKDN